VIISLVVLAHFSKMGRFRFNAVVSKQLHYVASLRDVLRAFLFSPVTLRSPCGFVFPVGIGGVGAVFASKES
jgi:hypothetical protein